MTVDNFSASAHYDDVKGSLAADWAFNNEMTELLKKRNLIAADEHLAGIEVGLASPRDATQDKLDVTVLLASLVGFDNLQVALDSGDPLPVRRVKFELTPNEFFSLFKFFSITLSTKGILENKDFSYQS